VCQPTAIFTGLPGPIQALATDGLYVYWSANSPNLLVGPVDGGKQEVFWVGSVYMPLAMVVDDTRLYWFDQAGVFSCPKDPAVCDASAPITSSPVGAPLGGLALDSNNLYFSVQTADSGIFWCPKASLCDGGAALLAAAEYPAAVAVAPGHVLWIAAGVGDVFEDVDAAATDIHPSGTASQLAANAARVYASDNASLWTCALGACGSGLTTKGSGPSINALAADPTTAYFTDPVGDLWSDSPDAGRVHLVTDGGAQTSGLAVDTTAIYWSTYDTIGSTSSIFRLAKP